MNPDEGTFGFDFQNADVSQETRPQFYIEASGELLTDKQRPIRDEEELAFASTPFIQNFQLIGNDIVKFTSRTAQFLNYIENEWPRIRRINELWLQGDRSYLSSEVNKLLSAKQFPMNNELEYLRGVHHLNLILLEPILDSKRFTPCHEMLSEEITLLFQSDLRECLSLVNHFEPRLHHFERKIFECISGFTAIYPHLIPIFSLSFIDPIPDELFTFKGITTASFADLKEFYVDSFETSVDVLGLLIAYNNLKYRKSYTTMKSMLILRSIKEIDQFENMRSKGEKLKFLQGDEIFDTLVYPYLRNDIRNAIGHNTFQFDVATQIVTIYQNGNGDDESAVSIYLMEFAKLCWDLFQSIILLAELIYQTRKVIYVSQGIKPIDPSVFTKAERTHRWKGKHKKK